MKSIIISQSMFYEQSRCEYRDFLDIRWHLFMRRCGYILYPVPNALSMHSDAIFALDSWVNRILPLGVILSGGNNVGACPHRDNLEASLLNLAENARMPVLGICRGMQFMGVRAGAGLMRVGGHAGVNHSINCFPSRVVNSFHGYSLSSCPENYAVEAICEDGCIEAISHRLLPWKAWMWHPERNDSPDVTDVLAIQSLFG